MREINTADKRFINGNGRDVLGTVVTAEWLNAVQDELVGVVKGFGGQVVPATPNQVYRAIKAALDEKIGNSGNQTISNGILTVGKPRDWPAIRIPSGTGVWEIETNPNSSAAVDGSISMGFKFVEAGQPNKGIIMSALNEGYENVAYQSWVRENMVALAGNQTVVGEKTFSEALTAGRAAHWDKYRMPVKSGGQWIIETDPDSDLGKETSLRCNIKYEQGGQARYIHFPAPQGGNKNVAYESWVSEQLKEYIPAGRAVMLTGNQTVGGVKTFSGRADFVGGIRIGGDNTERYSGLFRGNGDWYWSNPISGQSLQLKDNGDLAYQNRKIYHEGNKPAWADIQNKPAVAEMNKANTGSFTAGGQIKASYAADWAGFIVNQETEDKNVYFDASVRNVLRAGMQAKAVGTNGEYCMSLQVTPAGDKTRDRRVEGLGVYASGLHNHTYGWLHEFFARRTEMNEKSTVKVMTGMVYDGGTIPLPAGYSQEQCQWFVSLREDNTGGEAWDINENGSHNHFSYQIWADGNRHVHAKMYRNSYAPRSIHVNYIIIGVK